MENGPGLSRCMYFLLKNGDIHSSHRYVIVYQRVFETTTWRKVFSLAPHGSRLVRYPPRSLQIVAFQAQG